LAPPPPPPIRLRQNKQSLYQRDQREVVPADCWNWGEWGLKEYKWKVPFLGWFVGLVIPVQETFILPWLWSTKYNFFFPHRTSTLFQFLCPYQSATWASSRAGPPVSECESPASTVFIERLHSKDIEIKAVLAPKGRRGGGNNSNNNNKVWFSLPPFFLGCSDAHNLLPPLWKIMYPVLDVDWLVTVNSTFHLKTSSSVLPSRLYTATIFNLVPSTFLSLSPPLWLPSSNGYNVFCFLSSLPLLPPPATSVWVLPAISLLLTNTVLPVRACLIIW
jgi:hypothetical protein